MTSPEKIASTELVKTSHSEVESFLLCERRHFYSYGLNIEPIYTSDAIYRGVLTHAALATYYKARKDNVPHEDAVEAALDFMEFVEHEFENVRDRLVLRMKIVRLLEQYFENYREDDDWVILEVEQEVKTDINDANYLVFIIDLVARRRSDGKIFVWDHKVVNDFYNEDSYDLNPQLAKYVAGRMNEGQQVNGAMYNEIRYRDTKENAADPSKRFRRTPIQLTSNRVVTVMREQMLVARTIDKLKRRPLEDWEARVTRTASSTVCRICPFKDICIQDLNGLDRETALREWYRPKQNRESRNF